VRKRTERRAAEGDDSIGCISPPW